MAFTDVTDGSRTIILGVGATKVTLGGLVKTGDPIGISSGTYYQADANNSIVMELVAGANGDVADVITAYRAARIGGITTGTAGADLYLSNTAGVYATTAGTAPLIVGMELGGGEMWIAGNWAIPDDSVDSQHYIADSIDKEHLASEIYTIEHLTLIGSTNDFDTQTIKLARMWSAGTVVRVTYFSSTILGTSMGIDILDGGAAGSGTDVIDSCSDNLNGLDTNDLTTPYALSANDYICVKFDNVDASVDFSVDIQVKVPLGAAT